MSPKQTAAKQWALFRYMPFLISELIAGDEAIKYRELFLVLEEIVDILMGCGFTDTLLVYLSVRTETLFCSKAVSHYYQFSLNFIFCFIA
jgi:hypothetical protein